MREPEIALVFSPETWVEELHRSCTDHGGVRVRHLLLEPDLARVDEYDTLVVSHRWPGLSRALVGELHARGRRVLGACDAVEPGAREHLESLGVDAVVDGATGPDEIVAAVVALGVAEHGRASTPVAVAEAGQRRGPVVVVGGPAGGGATEVAIALAHGASRGGARWALLDADDVSPAVAPRLGLAPEPGLLAAIEASEHGTGDVVHCLQRAGSGADVVVGLAHGGGWAQVRPTEVSRLVRSLARSHAGVVVDTAAPLEDLRTPARGRYQLGRSLVADADVLVAVADARPVGIARLVEWLATARSLAPDTPVHVVVNRTPRDGYRRHQLRAEVDSLGFVRAVHETPEDRRIAIAAWEGTVPPTGGFTKGVADLVATAVSS